MGGTISPKRPLNRLAFARGTAYALHRRGRLSPGRMRTVPVLHAFKGRRRRLAPVEGLRRAESPGWRLEHWFNSEPLALQDLRGKEWGAYGPGVVLCSRSPHVGRAVDDLPRSTASR